MANDIDTNPWLNRTDLNEADDDPDRLARYTHQRFNLEVGPLEYVGGVFAMWSGGRPEPLKACVFGPFVHRSIRLALEESHATRFKKWTAAGHAARGCKPVMPKVTRALVSDVMASLRASALWADGSDYIGEVPKGAAR